MTGAGEHVEALPRGDRPPLIVVPLDAELSAGQVYASSTRVTPRAPRGARGRRARALRAGAPSRRVNDLEPAARRLCPAIDPHWRRCARSG